MNNILKILSISILAALVTGCSQVLQTIDLDINAEDNSVQEEFNVKEKTLTIKEARAQKKAPYPRSVLQNGRGDDAQPIPEKIALLSKFPKNSAPFNYKIGIGDTITFSRLIENNRSPLKILSQWPPQTDASNYKLGIGDTIALTLMRDEGTLDQMAPVNRTTNSDVINENQNFIINSQQNDVTIETAGRVGADGSVLLLEVGRLEATGKSLNELRSEVRNILIRNGVSPRFQLEIVEFKSQRAYLTLSGIKDAVSLEQGSSIIILNDQKTTLVDVLTAAGFGFVPGAIIRVNLQRGSKNYVMNLREIFSADTPEIIIRDRDHIFVEASLANIVTTSSIVDHKGNVIFENVGKIRAVGRSLEDLRLEITNLMQRVPDSKDTFQIQISNFISKSALLSTPGELGGKVITITDKPTTLAEILTENGLIIDGSNVTRINLQRDGETYVFTLDDLIGPNSPKIYLQPQDRITAEILPYKENKVFILGGVSPKIFKINPTNRESLADALFTEDGALSTSSAKPSEVYLLRGVSPVVAYHLDAQSPTRLIVAETMELRPNDILYVAEQPITTFNRTLATIIPLRLLLRDIEDGNIP